MVGTEIELGFVRSEQKTCRKKGRFYEATTIINRLINLHTTRFMNEPREMICQCWQICGFSEISDTQTAVQWRC